MSASDVPGGTARRPADVVLICRVAGNLPLPPPIAPQNANQFLPDTPESPFAQRETVCSHGFEISDGCHGQSMHPNRNSSPVSGLCNEPRQFGGLLFRKEASRSERVGRVRIVEAHLHNRKTGEEFSVRMHRLTMAAVGNLESVGTNCSRCANGDSACPGEIDLHFEELLVVAAAKFPATRHMRTTSAGRRAVPPGTSDADMTMQKRLRPRNSFTSSGFATSIPV